jgi:hypothetical protein
MNPFLALLILVVFFVIAFGIGLSKSAKSEDDVKEQGYPASRNKKSREKEPLMKAPIVFDIPTDAAPAICKGCKTTIYWIRTRAGKAMPVNQNGTSHFSTCSQANQFRRSK